MKPLAIDNLNEIALLY